MRSAVRLRAQALSLRNNAISALKAIDADVAPPPPLDERRFQEKPEWRLNWFLFQRTFPSDTLPSQGRFFAYEPFFKTHGLQPNLPPPTERWVSIGPTPISALYPSMGMTAGRVTCVAVSPVDEKTILVGGATGGIWRSTDGGNRFDPVSDDQVDMAVGSIAFAPSNASIVYAGMGDVSGGYMGTGVLKSIDGGRTWRRISGPKLPAPGLIANVAVEPGNPDRVYVTQYSYRASTGEGEVFASGFFLSTDGGVTWRRTIAGLPRDLVHHPTNANTLYLSLGDKFSPTAPSAGVYRSTDGGETWQVIFTPPYLKAHDIKIAVTPADPSVVYVFTGGDIRKVATVDLFVTRDSGATWEDLKLSDVDVGQFGYNSYIAVDPTRADTVYIGTRDIYKSNNGGKDWINLTRNWSRAGDDYSFNAEAATAHSDQHVLVFAPSAPNLIYIGNDGGLSRSADGGETFSSLNNMLSLTQFNSVTVHPTDSLRSCGGTQDNGALVRELNEFRWTEFLGGDSGGCLMSSTDPSIWFTSYIYGVLFRYSNFGNRYETQLTDPTTFEEDLQKPRIAFYPPFVLSSQNNRMYFASSRLFSSSDQGINWPKVNELDLTHGPQSQKYGPDVVSAIAVDPKNADVIITGSAQGRVMITTDGGRKWNDVTAGLPRRFITSLTIDSRSNAIYATVSGFGSGHVFRTVNQGTTWTSLSATLPNAPVNALLLDPVSSNTIYAGTDVGVFRSIDNGQTWTIFNQGMPPVIITGFSAQQSGLVQVATYGRGIYQLVR
ncbi:MAG TPA: hypothetical protein VFI24_21715 [Pyrinomonadaceae bacterium]|nr:hypothetical protein [Pyrinomonadaceae bacterium]